MVNSAGMTIHSKTPFAIEDILLSRTTVYAGLAMLALIACAMLPIRRLAWLGIGYPGSPSHVESAESRLGEPGYPEIDEPILSPAWFRALVREYINLWPLWAGAFGLLALLASVYIPGIRSPKNGSHRWINLHLPGLESVQPSELAKWGLMVLIAVYAACSLRRMRSFWLGLVPGLLATGLVAGFVVIEDLGTGALMGVAACIVLIAAGARLWHLLILCPVPLAGAALAIVTNPYRMHRIESFMNPYLDPQGKGFHMIQSMVSVANGQVFGRGLGGGLQKFGYLPEDTTDFIFATICEELGVAGAAIVLFLLGALIWSVWGIVRRENIALLKLLGLGVMATVGVQAAINLAVVTGLGPTKGIALPLISSGGTGWILTAAALGLVVAMDQAQHVVLRTRASRLIEPQTEPEGYAMPALGVMAMSAAAATATLSEIKPERRVEALISVTAEEDMDEEKPLAGKTDAMETKPDEEQTGVPQSVTIEPEDETAKMFEGVVEADVASEPVAALDPEPEPPPEPTSMVEAKPTLGIIPGEPGKTGLLFDPHADPAPSSNPPVPPAAIPQPPAGTPEIVITDHAKNWLTPSGEESAA